MKASDYIIEYLYARGVRQIYEVIGGMITHLVDSAYRHGKIQLVSVHHEQSAAFAADAAGRLTGIPGVAMGTSGPGATNLITGIGSCYFDSVPAIFITGQVNRKEQKGQRGTRQAGFQETDIVSIVTPITKGAWKLNNLEELPELLARAFQVSTSGRPGPVLLDIPMDLQVGKIEPDFSTIPEQTPQGVDPAQMEEILDRLQKAERPLLLVGGGVRSSHSVELLREFVSRVNIPTVNSLMAVDALPCQHACRVGLIGTYGNRWANTALGHSDFLLVLGSRLDIRQTGADLEGFKHGQMIVHVDCDPAEINTRVTGVLPVPADLKTFLQQAVQAAAGKQWERRPAWFEQIEAWRAAWPDTAEIQNVPGINPNQLMRQLSHRSALASTFISDVGNNQMWAAQSLQLNGRQNFITSGGIGSMGFALPAAVGAAFAIPGKPVVMIAGDGGMQMNIQELQTIVHHHLPVKIVVLNNHSLGMVRQFQQSYFEDRYQSTTWGYSAPDFCRVAAAYGISTSTVEEPALLDSALAKMWAAPYQPYLLEVSIDPAANVYPKIAFGRPITDMEPFFKPTAMEGA